ncbi:MAG TPA: hypothetical protein VMG10_24145 [Gemmataceae bacterium]|nr:hypothetical protein [Gemmataceae bacterium]
MWRHAWHAWTHPCGLLPAEVDACRLECVDHRLIVHAPQRLIERSRAAQRCRQAVSLAAGRRRPAAHYCSTPRHNVVRRPTGHGVRVAMPFGSESRDFSRNLMPDIARR